MAMTQSEIQTALHRAFSSYATKMRRANLVLGNSLVVLRREAEIAKITPEAFDAMARVEMDQADKRMQDDAARHPVVAPIAEAV
ncbi:hypothetical protein [Phaeobacter inhibens]|uniref:hypothetical protein n=1 Tax=Phaeobacter inhibens TaxID=221822 RepID=UPI00076BB549|nr:hypothetical protein [Phaeobacter inhibens]KXF92107.1 hypothetical protein AT574_03900 [Phaeobacter inhibens]WHP69942.1 hypothetical protein QMZ01_07145 [Phaeobacter inhibens]